MDRQIDGQLSWNIALLFGQISYVKGRSPQNNMHSKIKIINISI